MSGAMGMFNFQGSEKKSSATEGHFLLITVMTGKRDDASSYCDF